MIAIPGFATISAPPVQEWVRATGDLEAMKWVEDRLTTRDQYSVAAAVGIHMRLTNTNTPVLVNDEINTPHLDAAMAWIKSLTTEQLETIADLASAECHQLQTQLESLEDLAFDEAWNIGLRDLAHRRDDLEGVRAVLAEAGNMEILNKVDVSLQFLDQDASVFVYALPKGKLVGDQRLSRIAWMPDNWWGHGLAWVD